MSIQSLIIGLLSFLAPSVFIFVLVLIVAQSKLLKKTYTKLFWKVLQIIAGRLFLLGTIILYSL